jgi:putative phosphotransacetylase
LDAEQLIRDVVKNVLEKLLGEKSPAFQAGESLAPGGPGALGTAGFSLGAGSISGRRDRKVVCGVSVRHIHLCKEDLDILFGKGYELSVLRELYNPGFASKETLTVVGPKLTAIQNVRILGPLRSKTQVELAKTDCIVLGIDAPVRASGDTAGSSSCVLVGPKGAVVLKDGAIRANRHMHLSSVDADYFGIKDNQVVDVRVGGPKGLTFNNVQVRVAPDFKTELHVDTDDGNAADIVNGTMVEIVDASCISPLLSQMADKSMIPPSIPDGSFTGEAIDPNLIRNICAMATGQPCSKGQAAAPGNCANAAVSDAGTGTGGGLGTSEGTGGNSSGGTSLTKKTVITLANLDKFAAAGITVNNNIILSPLARDEAMIRGIPINYV